MYTGYTYTFNNNNNNNINILVHIIYIYICIYIYMCTLPPDSVRNSKKPEPARNPPMQIPTVK